METKAGGIMVGFGQSEAKPISRQARHTLDVCMKDESGNKHSLQRFVAGDADIAISAQYHQATFLAEKKREELLRQGIHGNSEVYIRTNSEVVKKMYPDSVYAK